MKFRFRRYYLYYLARVGAFLVRLLPATPGLAIAAMAGRTAYFILPKYRRIAVENLTFAFGRELTPAGIRKIARRVFENLGKNAFELVHFPDLNKDNIDGKVAIENRVYLDDALAKGRGVIVVSAHFGNWELMPAMLKMKGYVGAVVGRRIYFDRYDKFLNDLGRLHGVEIIYRDESVRKILKVLKANGIVGIVADQDVDSVEGIFVDFFGRSAYTPMGPAALAKASGAALMPAFMVRQNGRHALVFEEPIELVDTGRGEEDVRENTRRWSSVVESYVRRYPEQWVWMHRRWKTRKKDDKQ